MIDRNILRLNESEFVELISESVKHLLREYGFDDFERKAALRKNREDKKKMERQRNPNAQPSAPTPPNKKKAKKQVAKRPKALINVDLVSGTRGLERMYDDDKEVNGIHIVSSLINPSSPFDFVRQLNDYVLDGVMDRIYNFAKITVDSPYTKTIKQYADKIQAMYVIDDEADLFSKFYNRYNSVKNTINSLSSIDASDVSSLFGAYTEIKDKVIPNIEEMKELIMTMANTTSSLLTNGMGDAFNLKKIDAVTSSMDEKSARQVKKLVTAYNGLIIFDKGKKPNLNKYAEIVDKRVAKLKEVCDDGPDQLNSYDENGNKIAR